jgi:hypothetical protein
MCTYTGLTARVGGLAVEDSGVNLGLLVLTGTWDDSTLDTESGTVTTLVTSLE